MEANRAPERHHNRSCNAEEVTKNRYERPLLRQSQRLMQYGLDIGRRSFQIRLLTRQGNVILRQTDGNDGRLRSSQTRIQGRLIQALQFSLLRWVYQILIKAHAVRVPRYKFRYTLQSTRACIYIVKP
jgi:hypothetical protein